MTGVVDLKAYPDEDYHQLPLPERIARIQEYYLETGIYHARQAPTGKPLGLLSLQNQVRGGNVPPDRTK